MAWKSVAVAFTAVRAPLKIGTFKPGAGVAKTSVTFRGSLLEELGEPARCNVFKGDGSDKDASQMMIQFDDDGDHTITRFNRGGGRLLMPLLEGASKTRQEPRPVQYVTEKADDGTVQLIIALPF